MKSVIIRGSIKNSKRPVNYLKESLQSLRSWFTGEVILSTWENQESFLDEESKKLINKVVFCPDPGPGPVQHFNRQVTSYMNGVTSASSEDVMVMRSDIVVKQDPFYLTELYTKTTNSNKLKLFNNKIVVSNMMTINPESSETPRYFRICDWIHLGKRSDLISFGNIFNQMKDIDPKKINQSNCTETLWVLCWLKNNFGDIVDIYNSENINHLYYEILVNNFAVVDLRSTMKAENNNWSFQPEYHPAYMSEKQYSHILETLCK